MRAGRLDRRVRIERAVVTKNAHNEPVSTWELLAEVWAGKRDLATTERFASAQVAADITTEFTIRFRSDVTPKHRLVIDGLIYDIKGSKELGRREGLIIMAAARTDEN